ncbi:MAG: hypothetical protein O4965_25605 [Trichodesmium sp. St19_bin1]|nr:hypothetical protein [Trichodesmium sp. St19_bin1]
MSLRKSCRIKEIKDYLKQLFWLAVHEPNWLQKPYIEKLVADDFVPLLISQILIKWNSKSSLKPSRRAKLIAQNVSALRKTPNLEIAS